MSEFRPIDDTDPALAHSPLLRAARLTFDYIAKEGPIGLTPTKALKRYFVHWAASAFEWPRYTAEELFAINKVLNEPDFTPLMILHDVLLGAKLVRHYKGAMHVTKLGQELYRRPGALWEALAHQLLNVLDHSPYTRHGDRLEGDWDLFLNLLNVEAQTGMTEDRFVSLIFGADDPFFRFTSMAYIHILRPLSWAGLLSEHRYGTPYPSERLFLKTPLWPVALSLSSDSELSSPILH
jgi:hypothetical protein